MDQDNKVVVLTEAMRIKGGYMPVAEAVLAAMPTMPPDVGVGIRAMAYGMATFNQNNPHPAIILDTIQNSPWEKLGISGLPPLEPAQRAGIVEVIMGACKQIIADEAARLAGVAGLDTAPAEGEVPGEEPGEE